MKKDIIRHLEINKNSIITSLFTSFITLVVVNIVFVFAFGPPKTYHELINLELSPDFQIGSLFSIIIFLPVIMPMTITNWIALKIFNVQMEKKGINKDEILFIGCFIILLIASMLYGIMILSWMDEIHIHKILSILISLIIIATPGALWGACYFSFGCKLLNTFKKWLMYFIIMLLYVFIIQCVYGNILYFYPSRLNM